MEPGDMVVMVDPKMEIETHLARDISARYADIRPILKNGIKEVEQLKRTTEMIGEGV